MKLYYYPGACSLAVHVAMNELGLEYEIEKIDIKKGDNKKPEYLALNPRGQVATLVTDDGVLTENAAIIIHLNDRYEGKLLNKSGYERAIALQWLMFANSGLHGAYSKYMFLKKNNCTAEDVLKAAEKNVQEQWDEIERHLNQCGTSYMAGNEVTAGDIYITVVANWDFLPSMPKFGPKTSQLLHNVSRMPSYQTAMANEGVDYKAAA